MSSATCCHNVGFGTALPCGRVHVALRCSPLEAPLSTVAQRRHLTVLVSRTNIQHPLRPSTATAIQCIRAVPHLRPADKSEEPLKAYTATAVLYTCSLAPKPPHKEPNSPAPLPLLLCNMYGVPRITSQPPCTPLLIPLRNMLAINLHLLHCYVLPPAIRAVVLKETATLHDSYWNGRPVTTQEANVSLRSVESKLRFVGRGTDSRPARPATVLATKTCLITTCDVPPYHMTGTKIQRSRFCTMMTNASLS